MKIKPIELRDANAFIALHHRHHKPVQGHRFSISAWEESQLVGVAVVGRPVARKIDASITLEVTRLCTDGTKNACSMLYAAAARVGKELGYQKIQTYILASETGASLKASGWINEGEAGGGSGCIIMNQILAAKVGMLRGARINRLKRKHDGRNFYE